MTPESFIGYSISSVSSVCPPPGKDFCSIKNRCWPSTNQHDQSPLVLLNRLPITVFNVIPMLNDRRMYRVWGQPYTILWPIKNYIYKCTMVQEWRRSGRPTTARDTVHVYFELSFTRLHNYQALMPKWILQRLSHPAEQARSLDEYPLGLEFLSA